MVTSLFLLDVAPDPVRGPIIGIADLILIVVIVLMLAAAGVTGLVFLLWLMRRTPKTTPGTEARSEPVFQPSSPNQP